VRNADKEKTAATDCKVHVAFASVNCNHYDRYTTIVFVLALIIVSIVTAAKNSRSDAVGGKAAAFTGAQQNTSCFKLDCCTHAHEQRTAAAGVVQYICVL
jgi:hypothetical protein